MQRLCMPNKCAASNLLSLESVVLCSREKFDAQRQFHLHDKQKIQNYLDDMQRTTSWVHTITDVFIRKAHNFSIEPRHGLMSQSRHTQIIDAGECCAKRWRRWQGWDHAEQENSQIYCWYFLVRLQTLNFFMSFSLFSLESRWNSCRSATLPNYILNFHCEFTSK